MKEATPVDRVDALAEPENPPMESHVHGRASAPPRHWGGAGPEAFLNSIEEKFGRSTDWKLMVHSEQRVAESPVYPSVLFAVGYWLFASNQARC
jgi:hypothetical protein